MRNRAELNRTEQTKIKPERDVPLGWKRFIAPTSTGFSRSISPIVVERDALFFMIRQLVTELKRVAVLLRRLLVAPTLEILLGQAVRQVEALHRIRTTSR